jgi:hypothetical protein
MTRIRKIAHIWPISALIAGMGVILPMSAAAQTATETNDPIKQLQSEIRTIQKQNEAQQKQYQEQQKQYQAQIRSLQKQLDDLKAAQVALQAAPPPAPGAPARLAVPPTAAALPPPVPGGPGTPPPPPAAVAAKHGIFGTGIEVSLANTYLEGASIFRSRNEVADLLSNWNTGIPMPNNPNYHLSEFRETGRGSRLAMLAQGSVDEGTTLAGYVETDFLSAGTTSNSVETNSYTLRLRQAYATLDKKDWGTSILGGQAWSLLTLFNSDMALRREQIPLTIDSQYIPGFTYTRNPQFRVVQHFDDMFAAGLSLESPQAIIFPGPQFTPPNVPPVPTTFNNPGGMVLNQLATYSTDVGPDVVVKLTADPGVGHFELYGVGRAFRSRAAFANHTIFGGGGGAGAILPIVPKLLDFQADFLAGNGIGRYGAAQLPDVTVKPTGVLAPVPEIQALVGLVGHPTPSIDLYAYAGVEQAYPTAFTVHGTLPFGYGNLLYDNSGCLHEAASVAAAAMTCAANTERVWQITGGFWWDVYKGDFGRLRVGGQGSYTERSVFAGIGGGPNTNEGIFMASLRYYPFAP